jgi:hypothetical protein
MRSTIYARKHMPLTFQHGAHPIPRGVPNYHTIMPAMLHTRHQYGADWQSRTIAVAQNVVITHRFGIGKDKGTKLRQHPYRNGKYTTSETNSGCRNPAHVQNQVCECGLSVRWGFFFPQRTAPLGPFCRKSSEQKITRPHQQPYRNSTLRVAEAIHDCRN